MRGRTGHRRTIRAILAALALGGLAVLGVAGGEAVARLGLAGRAWAQPDRGLQPTIPGDTVVPPPNQFPGDRPDRWLSDPDPFARPTLEVEGTLESIDGTVVLLAGEALPGTGPATTIARAGTAIDLADDTTYYVDGQVTTFDRVPEGVPARVTYEYRGDRRVALRVEALEGEPLPALPEPAP